MEISFGSGSLARLCNSKQQLARRFGADRGQDVARRLCDVAAADLDVLDRLPGVRVDIDNDGGARIDCDGSIVIAGALHGGRADDPEADEPNGLLIISVLVDGIAAA